MHTFNCFVGKIFFMLETHYPIMVSHMTSSPGWQYNINGKEETISYIYTVHRCNDHRTVPNRQKIKWHNICFHVHPWFPEWHQCMKVCDTSTNVPCCEVHKYLKSNERIIQKWTSIHIKTSMLTMDWNICILKSVVQFLGYLMYKYAV